MELKESIKNTVYVNFINGSVENLKIDPFFDEDGYCSVSFSFEGLYFSWSVNKKGYICQHEPFSSSNNNNLSFNTTEKENICEIVNNYVSKHKESNKEKLNRIYELKKEINKLLDKIV